MDTWRASVYDDHVCTHTSHLEAHPQHSQYRGCHGFHCRETLQLKKSGVSWPHVTGNNFTAWSNACPLGSFGVLVSWSFHKARKTHTFILRDVIEVQISFLPWLRQLACDDIYSQGPFLCSSSTASGYQSFCCPTASHRGWEDGSDQTSNRCVVILPLARHPKATSLVYFLSGKTKLKFSCCLSLPSVVTWESWKLLDGREQYGSWLNRGSCWQLGLWKEMLKHASLGILIAIRQPSEDAWEYLT